MTTGEIEIEYMDVALTYKHIMSDYCAQIAETGEYEEDVELLQINTYLKK